MGDTPNYAGAGWFIVSRDTDGREHVALDERYSTREHCEKTIRHVHIPAAGLLGARLWDGEKWI